MSLLFKPFHLVARFVTSLPPWPPSIDDENWVDDQLLPAERRLWVHLDNRDRRHSVLVARRFVRLRPQSTRPEIAGALLHDIGKIECHLGTFGRVVATLVGSRTPRFAAYRDHVRIGADLVDEAGSDPVTVELVAGEGPLYETLLRCDRA